MKQITISIILIMMFSIVTNNILAQSNMKTDTITISGNCGQCKERIEEASYVKGVKSAEWNKKTKILTVVYNSEKTDLDKITAAIAKAGHDSKAHKATDKEYKKLPDCCAYRSGECHHE